MRGHAAPLAVLAYVVLTTTQGIYLGSLVQRDLWHPITLLVLTFGIVGLFFNLLQLPRLKAYAEQLRASAGEVLFLNVITAVNWLSYFWAIRTVPVSTHASIALGVGPLGVVLLTGWAGAGRGPRRGELVSAVGLGTTVLALALLQSGRSAAFDLAMSFACGTSLVVTLFTQRRLKARGWTPGQMMACRFFLLLAVGSALAPDLSLRAIGGGPALQVLLIAFLGTILPLYLLTWGQCHCRPMTSAMLVSSMPLLMIVGELLEGRVAPSAPVLAGVAATTVLLSIGGLSK
jgi:hypothetical protein